MKKTALLICTVIISMSTALRAQHFSDPLILISSPGSIGHFSVADLNEDGYQDVITNHLTWHPNALAPGNESAKKLASYCRIFSLAPIDDDPFPDLVTYTGKDLYLLRGTADPLQFADPQLIGSISDVTAIEIADLDADGHQDILLPQRLSRYMRWFRSSGDDLQFTLQSVEVNTFYSRTQIADTDKDGDTDITFISNGLLYLIEQTDSDASLQTPVQIGDPSLVDIRAYQFEDVDKNGHPDIILATEDQGLRLLFSNGEYNYETSLIDNRAFIELELADLDQDGDQDMVALSGTISSNSDHAFHAFEHFDGRGTFGYSRQLYALEAGIDNWLVKDMDNNGLPDIVGHINNTLYTIDNFGWTGEDSRIVSMYRTTDAVKNFLLNDIDGDKDPELVVDAPSGFLILENSSTTQEKAYYIKQRLSRKSIDNTAALSLNGLYDLDDDGDLDLIFNSGRTLYWSQYLAEQGKYQPAGTLMEGESLRFYIADWDADGLLDIINLGATGAVFVHLQEAGMQFTKHLALDTFYSVVSGKIRSYTIEDVDNDGDLDIAFEYQDGDWNLRWFERENGTLNLKTTPCAYRTGFTSRFTDYDLDGDLDLLYTNSGDPNLRIIRFDQQQGCFLPSEVIYDQLPLDARLLQVQDVDRNGRPDVVYTQDRTQPHPIVILQQKNNGLTPHQITTNKAMPSQVEFTDLNEDKVADILYRTQQVYFAGNLENEKLYLHYGEESIFSPGPVLYPGPPTGLSHQRWVDLDGDGDRDLLAFNEFELVWYPNIDAHGLLSQAIPLASGDYPKGSLDHRLHTIDYDSDGDLDVVLIRTKGSTSLHVLVNDQGTFTAHPLFSWLPVYEVSASQVTDINGDGKPDLVMKIRDRDLEMEQLWLLLKEPGNNTFYSEPQPAQLGSSTDAGRYDGLIDLDQDGDLDVLGRTAEGKLIWYEHADDLWSFNPPEIIPGDIQTNLTLNLGDLNGDGFRDLVTCVNFNGVRQFVWFRNEQDKLFSSPIPIYEGCELGPKMIDFDQDGDLDIVANGRLYVNADGAGTYFTRVTMNTEGYSIESIADINNDGAMEIVSKGQYLLGTPGRLNFSAYRNLGQFNRSFNPRFVTDINLDGNQDIVFEEVNSVFWLEGMHDGTDKITTGRAHFLFQKDLSHSIIYRVTDLNQDGLPDLVVTGPNRNIRWYPGKSAPGTLGPFVSIGPVNPIVPNSPVPFAIADIDQDGFLDVIIHASNKDDFRWYRHLDGQGSFAVPVRIGGSPSRTFQVKDLDQNGTLDIILADHSLKWMSNDGAGNFSEPVEIIPGSDINAFTILDINQDERLDIVYKDLGAREINLAIQQNEGNVTFGDKATLLYNAEQAAFWIFDVNKDFLPDLVLQQPNLVRWRQGQGNGQFFPLATLITDDHPSGSFPTSWKDLDQDKDVDMLYANDFYQIIWRKNLSNEPLIQTGYFLDEDLDGQKDSSEILLTGQSVRILPLSLKQFTDTTGLINIYVSPGNYTLESVVDSLWELTTESSYQFKAENETVIERFFGLTPVIDTSIISIYSTLGPPRCNTTVPAWFTFKNDGTRIEDGRIKIALNPLTELEHVAPLPTQINGDTLIWEVTRWAPLKTIRIDLLLKMPPETFTGQLIAFESRVDLEESQFDHTLGPFTVRCSFDPNDKLVAPQRGGPNYALFQETMTYTIRFQNTGNDTAFQVTITDQLDEKLDWSTFQPVASSHDCDVSITDEGLATFIFRDILLPDSTTNEPASHGFVQYTITAKEWPEEGEIIQNTGGIYFDYNQAIITNTIENTLVSILPTTNTTEKYRERIPVKVYPNPAGNSFTLDLLGYQSAFPLRFSLYNARGKHMFSTLLSQTKHEVSLKGLPGGSYYYHIRQMSNNRILGSGKLIHQ